MAASLRRDRFAWFSSVPSCITLLACLALPQVRDCHGDVKSAAQNGTSALLVVVAIIALAPLAWRWRVARVPVMMLAIAAAVVAVKSSVIVLPIAIYFAVARPWQSTEPFVALLCASASLLFVVLFPLLGVSSELLVGAWLAWCAGVVVMASSFAWASAARWREAYAGLPSWDTSEGRGPSH